MIKKLLKSLVISFVKFNVFLDTILDPVRQLKIKARLKKYGPGVDIHKFVVVNNPENVELGNHVSIASFVHIWGGGGITIGNRVLIGSHTAIVSETHDYLEEDMYSSHIKKKITIGNNVWIGTHVVVLPGVTIGNDCVIGAGSIVIHDVKPNTIVVGTPAKELKKRIPNE